MKKLWMLPIGLGLVAGVVQGQNLYCADYEAIPSNFFDISATGALVLDVGDDVGALAPIGFNFDFCGVVISSINATSNGYLTTGTTLGDFTPDCIPTTDEPNALIAPYWSDLSLDDHGDIFVETVGPPNDQVCIIQWDDLGAFGASVASYTFQAQLFEADGDIEFHYDVMLEAGGLDTTQETVGVEGGDGLTGVEISCADVIDLTVGYRIFKADVCPPYLEAPTGIKTGETLCIQPYGTPLHLYIVGGVTACVPVYTVLGVNLQLAPTAFTNPAGIGFIGPNGLGTKLTYAVPVTTPPGTIIYTQMVTVGQFGPIGLVQATPLALVPIRNCVSFCDFLDANNQTSDIYTLTGATAGEVLTIRLCRKGDQPDGTSLLDPRLCVYPAGGAASGGTGLVTDDDSLGDCFVSGPFGASIIEDWIIPADGDYDIAASAWDGTMGPYSIEFESDTLGSFAFTGQEVTGGCFN